MTQWVVWKKEIELTPSYIQDKISVIFRELHIILLIDKYKLLKLWLKKKMGGNMGGVMWRR
jgi:hypothetical protein